MQCGGVELIFRVHARGRGLERSSAVPNHAHDFARAPLAHALSSPFSVSLDLLLALAMLPSLDAIYPAAMIRSLSSLESLRLSLPSSY